MSLNRSPGLIRVSLNQARDLRRKMTDSEHMLWVEIRGRRLDGVKFIRQRPILVELENTETFAVADFYCAAAGLVVEVDGAVHDGHKSEDAARDLALTARGYRVLRATVAEVEQDIETVLRRIRSEVQQRVNSPPFSPSLP